MQNVSSSYLLEIKKPSRSFECKVTIRDNIYTNADIINITIEDVQPSDGFSIGSAVSKSLELTLSTNNTIYSNSIVKVEIGLNVGSKIEYVLMGYFNIDDIEKTDYSIKLTCYDNMMKFEKPYFSNLGKTSSLKNIVNELSQITGVEFTGSLPSYNLNKLEGFTCREILGFVASLCAGNAYITRDGKFTINTPKTIGYSITDENYIDLKTEESIYKVGAVICKVNEKELTKGTLSNSSMEVAFENPWVNNSILTDIYNKLKGFEYIGYSMKWQGDFSLDVGDIISITDTKGIIRQVPILSQKFNYNGGLTSEIGAKGESKNKNEFNSTGNLSNKVNRVVTDLLLVNEALINKADIEDLKAVNATIENLIAENVTITGKLNAIEGEFGTLKANVGVIDKLTVTHTAQINSLEANKASITQLNAVSANIGSLEVEVGKIQTLVNGNLTSDNIHSLILTSSKVTVENGFIKNAMIENVDVSKVNAGDISTNKFRIKSDDGGIEIVGATQQFKDKNNKVRIQMGKDTQGNFNFIIRGEDGTTTLIDHTGIKEKAIADDLIKETMIAQDAVGEKQINYSSFITGFNKDTNTNTIKSTKIMLNNQNQTLEVAFNSLKTQADGTKSLTESHSTTIGVMQGQITGLISDTTIVEDGTSKKIKDAYTSLKATVNGISSKVSSVESSFNNMQIGGRNIIENSAFSDGYIYRPFAPSAATVTATIVNDSIHGKVLKITKTDSLDSFVGVHTGGYLPTRNLIPNAKYSYSAWVKADSNTIVYMGLQGSGVNNSKSFNITTSWQRIKIEDEKYIALNPSFRFYTNTTTPFYVAKPMLEQSTKCGDWSPAPEDVDTKVTALDITVKSTSSKVSAIEQSIESITQRVSSTETNVTTVTNTANAAKTQADKAIADAKAATDKATSAQSSANSANSKIDGLQIGGRNLITGSSNTLQNIKIGQFNGTVGRWSRKHCSEYGLKAGDTITFSVEVNALNKSKLGARIDFYSEPSGDVGKTSKTNSNSIVTKGDTKVVYVTATIPKGKEYILLLVANHNTSIDTTDTIEKYRYDKLEIGNKATSWTPAIEDTQSQIDANKTEISSTKSKVSTIETNLTGITQRVGAVETNQTSVNGKVISLETWKKSAESKLTKEGLTTIISNHYTTSNDVNGIITSKGYQTHSQVQQTVDKLQAKFTSSGGYNKLYNSAFLTGDLTSWTSFGGGTVTVQNSSNSGFAKSLKFVSTGPSQGVMQSVNNLKPGKKYTLIALVNPGGKTGIQVLENNVYYQVYNSKTSGWETLSVTFTAATTSASIRLSTLAGGTAGTHYYAGIVFTEGELVVPWSPHPSEVYEGITTIDKDGITVTASNVKSKTTITANGFRIIKTDTNEAVFKVNSSGRLLLDGEFTTHNGNRKSGYFGLDQIKFYNWWSDSNEAIAFFYGGKTSDNKRSADVVGKDMVSLGVGQPNSGTKVLEGSSSSLKIYKNTDFNGYKITNLNAINEDSVSKDLWINKIFLRTNQINSAMDSGNLNINYWRGGTATSSSVKVCDGTNSGTQGKLQCGDFKAYGTKNACVQTDIGYVDINAYETADYYFGDIGETILDNDGYSYVYIDSLFAQTVNTTRKYQVFLSVYGEGYANVIERTPNYFVIKGTPGIEIGYEIKAKRKGYEDYRLERDVNSFIKGEEHGLDLDYKVEKSKFEHDLTKSIQENLNLENKELILVIDKNLERAIGNKELINLVDERIEEYENIN